jgi:RNA polymerase sigma factor (sigma-70 family)
VEAFEILAREYRPMVATYLRSLVSEPELAEDLVQETFLAAQRALENFDRSGNFGAWLRGIARNKALESRRAEARRFVIANSSIVEGMEEVYSGLDAPSADRPDWSARAALVRECAGRLNAMLRGAVEEVYDRGRSLRHAAEALGVSFEALAQRLSRARALIRDCVQLHLAEGSRS